MEYIIQLVLGRYCVYSVENVVEEGKEIKKHKLLFSANTIKACREYIRLLKEKR